MCCPVPRLWPEGKIDWCWFGYTCAIAALECKLDRLHPNTYVFLDKNNSYLEWKWRLISYKECLMSQAGWWDQNMARRFKGSQF